MCAQSAFEKKDVTRKMEERGLKNKIQKSLPQITPLPGSVCVQWRRCGKVNCKCAKGELHGGYYYHFYYVRGKLHKQYVKKREVLQVKAGCLMDKNNRREMRQLIEESKGTGNGSNGC
jgi:hypothetical protein